MPRFMVTVDGAEFDIEVQYRSNEPLVRLNGEEVKVTRYELGESRALLLIDGGVYEIDVSSNGAGFERSVFLKGQEISASIEDYNLAQLRKTAGISSESHLEKIVRAPMPGMLLEINVKAGDTVKKGQPILIIEAMKMENVIKAQGDGVVKEIFVKSGVSVEKDDKLMEYE